ncbi:hypothetical protein PTSG_10775 [Salpingoeca rosetta]|uniref:Uncharacterized protein n=1 Tax=Salpingoeca rosetta (strain ATCC 50818 / BSB-021) TaxID=946362 RepID=F2UQC2_SALR5|nr:uncharacterized protein PTSG_10775 [Salpingoeca rosetta]EGD79790.1 hypothetical protein PTSG_10775 [Salpingoeca rosetta]|eukprot:XP_004988739.1 hypothetical protein PTSG_10775 [Salpingoeca rosetta]
MMFTPTCHPILVFVSADSNNKRRCLKFRAALSRSIRSHTQEKEFFELEDVQALMTELEVNKDLIGPISEEILRDAGKDGRIHALELASSLMEREDRILGLGKMDEPANPIESRSGSLAGLFSPELAEARRRLKNAQDTMAQMQTKHTEEVMALQARIAALEKQDAAGPRRRHVAPRRTSVTSVESDRASRPSPAASQPRKDVDADVDKQSAGHTDRKHQDRKRVNVNNVVASDDATRPCCQQDGAEQTTTAATAQEETQEDATDQSYDENDQSIEGQVDAVATLPPNLVASLKDDRVRQLEAQLQLLRRAFEMEALSEDGLSAVLPSDLQQLKEKSAKLQELQVTVNALQARNRSLEQALANQDKVYRAHVSVLQATQEPNADIEPLLRQVHKQISLQRQLVDQLLSDLEASKTELASHISDNTDLIVERDELYRRLQSAESRRPNASRLQRRYQALVASYDQSLTDISNHYIQTLNTLAEATSLEHVRSATTDIKSTLQQHLQELRNTLDEETKVAQQFARAMTLDDDNNDDDDDDDDEYDDDNVQHNDSIGSVTADQTATRTHAGTSTHHRASATSSANATDGGSQQQTLSRQDTVNSNNNNNNNNNNNASATDRTGGSASAGTSKATRNVRGAMRLLDESDAIPDTDGGFKDSLSIHTPSSRASQTLNDSMDANFSRMSWDMTGTSLHADDMACEANIPTTIDEEAEGGAVQATTMQLRQGYPPHTHNLNHYTGGGDGDGDGDDDGGELDDHNDVGGLNVSGRFDGDGYGDEEREVRDFQRIALWAQHVHDMHTNESKSSADIGDIGDNSTVAAATADAVGEVTPDQSSSAGQDTEPGQGKNASSSNLSASSEIVLPAGKSSSGVRTPRISVTEEAAPASLQGSKEGTPELKPVTEASETDVDAVTAGATAAATTATADTKAQTSTALPNRTSNGSIVAPPPTTAAGKPRLFASTSSKEAGTDTQATHTQQQPLKTVSEDESAAPATRVESKKQHEQHEQHEQEQQKEQQKQQQQEAKEQEQKTGNGESQVLASAMQQAQGAVAQAANTGAMQTTTDAQQPQNQPQQQHQQHQQQHSATAADTTNTGLLTRAPMSPGPRARAPTSPSSPSTWRRSSFRLEVDLDRFERDGLEAAVEVIETPSSPVKHGFFGGATTPTSTTSDESKRVTQRDVKATPLDMLHRQHQLDDNDAAAKRSTADSIQFSTTASAHGNGSGTDNDTGKVSGGGMTDTTAATFGAHVTNDQAKDVEPVERVLQQAKARVNRYASMRSKRSVRARQPSRGKFMRQSVRSRSNTVSASSQQGNRPLSFYDNMPVSAFVAIGATTTAHAGTMTTSQGQGQVQSHGQGEPRARVQSTSSGTGGARKIAIV